MIYDIISNCKKVNEIFDFMKKAAVNWMPHCAWPFVDGATYALKIIARS